VNVFPLAREPLKQIVGLQEPNKVIINSNKFFVHIMKSTKTVYGSFNPLKPRREREKRKWGGVAIGTTFNGRGRT
jgi:hypothetical protein